MTIQGEKKIVFIFSTNELYFGKKHILTTMNLTEKFLTYVNIGYALLNTIKIHKRLSKWLHLYSS